MLFFQTFMTNLVLTHSSHDWAKLPFLGLLDHVCTLIKINTTNGLYLCYPLQKQILFITCTTHFRSVWRLKTLIFQYKSFHCCHTLLKVNKDHCILYISETIRHRVKILTDMNSLRYRLYTVKKTHQSRSPKNMHC